MKIAWITVSPKLTKSPEQTEHYNAYYHHSLWVVISFPFDKQYPMCS